MSILDLPLLNASLNSLAAFYLISGKLAQRRGDFLLHRKKMLRAVASSALFLFFYLVYHFNTDLVTTWQLPGKPLYLAMLISHVLLAIAMLPGIIAAIVYALQGQNGKHQRLVRWVWPVWLYVSVTGVMIYVLLYQIQPLFNSVQ